MADDKRKYIETEINLIPFPLDVLLEGITLDSLYRKEIDIMYISFFFRSFALFK